MLSCIRLFTGGVLVAAAMLAGSTAGAVTADLRIDRFDRSALASAQAEMADFLTSHTVKNLRQETFEGYAAWNGSSGTSSPQNTKVGSFSALGDAGSGASVVGNGAKLQVRDDNDMFWGRYNANELPPGLVGGKWLDSNDNTGMEWKIAGLGTFNALAFFVIDAADVRAILAGSRPLAGAESGPEATDDEHEEGLPLREILDRTERRLILAALGAANGTVSEAARQLGLDRANLHRKMRRLGIERADAEDADSVAEDVSD